LLDDEETFIRDHILNLTCKHHTCWAFTSPFEQAYMRSCLPKLDEAEADGLIERYFDRIKLTETGKLFVRNVCAAFDKNYEGREITRKYSMGI
jgi:oxygen-independent coproporphyrinogen-3 oxidase